MISVFRRARWLVLTGCVLLLCVLLAPSGARAIEYGHLKVLPAPNPPEIRCGEPGDMPNGRIDALVGYALDDNNQESGSEQHDRLMRDSLFCIILGVASYHFGMSGWITHLWLSKQK